MDINTAEIAYLEAGFAAILERTAATSYRCAGGAAAAAEGRVASGQRARFFIDFLIHECLGQKTGELSEDHGLDWGLL